MSKLLTLAQQLWTSEQEASRQLEENVSRQKISSSSSEKFVRFREVGRIVSSICRMNLFDQEQQVSTKMSQGVETSRMNETKHFSAS